METGRILYQWHFDLFIMLFTCMLVYFYYSLSDFKFHKSAFYFWLAIFLFLIVECSPLHFLGMHYFFSAHMISHVVILLLCGPLLVISIPPVSSATILKRLRSFSSFLYKRSWIAWISGVGIMWLWHIPVIFDGSFTHMQSPFNFFPLLHAGSMLIAGMIFSWPIFGPFPSDHIHPLTGVVYLFTACVSCSLLGLLITFAPADTYHHYLDINRSMNMVNTNLWNISRAEDQQAAGLIMWVPCCFIYLSGCFYLLYRWFSEKDILPKNELDKLNVTTGNGG